MCSVQCVNTLSRWWWGAAHWPAVDKSLLAFSVEWSGSDQLPQLRNAGGQWAELVGNGRWGFLECFLGDAIFYGEGATGKTSSWPLLHVVAITVSQTCKLPAAGDVSASRCVVA